MNAGIGGQGLPPISLETPSATAHYVAKTPAQSGAEQKQRRLKAQTLATHKRLSGRQTSKGEGSGILYIFEVQ